RYRLERRPERSSANQVSIVSRDRKPYQKAAPTISVGAMIGIRNRSCGKNSKQTSTADAASEKSASGGCDRRRHAAPPSAANGSRIRYDAIDQPRYNAECSAYDGPTGTTV